MHMNIMSMFLLLKYRQRPRVLFLPLTDLSLAFKSASHTGDSHCLSDKLQTSKHLNLVKTVM